MDSIPLSQDGKCAHWHFPWSLFAYSYQKCSRHPPQIMVDHLKSCFHSRCYLITLQGTNISPQNGIFEDDFPFPKVGYVSSLEGIPPINFSKSSLRGCDIVQECPLEARIRGEGWAWLWPTIASMDRSQIYGKTQAANISVGSKCKKDKCAMMIIMMRWGLMVMVMFVYLPITMWYLPLRTYLICICMYLFTVQVKSGGSSLFNWESIGCNSDFVC